MWKVPRWKPVNPSALFIYNRLFCAHVILNEYVGLYVYPTMSSAPVTAEQILIASQPVHGAGSQLLHTLHPANA
jgi:hypothetical protein